MNQRFYCVVNPFAAGGKLGRAWPQISQQLSAALVGRKGFFQRQLAGFHFRHDVFEFGERGFHEGSISGITGRAGVALGTFYTYFASKDEIFRALVSDMSGRVRDHVAPALAAAPDPLSGERAALEAFLRFAAEHKEIYRIVDESEFVDPASFRRHY